MPLSCFLDDASQRLGFGRSVHPRGFAHPSLGVRRREGPAQQAIAEYLKQAGFDHHLRKLRTVFERQQARMLQAIGRHFPAQMRVTWPIGGYFLWVQLPEKVKTLELFQRARERKISSARMQTPS